MERESFLKEGEVITEKVRKHFIVYIEDFILHSFGCCMFIGLAYFLLHSKYVPFLNENSGVSIAMALFGFVILFWTSFFYAWTKNYLDVWYVTNEHIIAVNQKQIFEREEAFMELSRIQDVFFEQKGILGTFLGYGQLKVQSAGTEQEFIIENVMNVEQVAHRIMELRDQVRVRTQSGL